MAAVPTASAAGNPRTASLIRRGKAGGATAAFAIAALASVASGAVLFDCLLRGLVAGALGYVLGWAAAVHAGRHLLKAETQALIERELERRRLAEAARAARS
jgi:hypothetical protein